MCNGFVHVHVLPAAHKRDRIATDTNKVDLVTEEVVEVGRAQGIAAGKTLLHSRLEGARFFRPESGIGKRNKAPGISKRLRKRGLLDTRSVSKSQARAPHKAASVAHDQRQ